tara:strand:+ start:12016 stop:13164 length:1149 start_codon:yes stop_codon:yes gene_type:complete
MLPLLLRPVVVIVEAMLLENSKILIFVMPISMIALALSSVPVHLEFYKALNTNKEMAGLAKQYTSSIIWILVVACTGLYFFLTLPFMELRLEIVLIIIFTFVIEKISDEISRSLEFSKQFGRWCLIQSIRSSWFAFPIIFYMQGVEYIISFLYTAILFSGLYILLFFRITGLRFNITKDGLTKIYKNSIYLVGTLLPISYQQAPRLIVAKLYPDIAHIFLAMSQLSQGVSLLFNVRYQIPYRKAIARHTYTFQRIYWPIMRGMLLCSVGISIVYFLFSSLVDTNLLNELELSIVLAPALIANALVFCILSSHLGYMVWVIERRSALISYLLCILFGFSALVVLFTLELITSIFTFSALISLIGAFWICFIVWRHFNVKCRIL